MKKSILAIAFLGILFSCGKNTQEAEIPVSSISLSQPAVEMVIGEAVQLTATVQPSNASSKAITWASSKASVATVESGRVTAIAEGTATITASAGGKSATCAITVGKGVIAVTSVELNKTTLELVEGESDTLVVTVKPSDATDKTVAWSTSSASIATVENGKVTAIKEGEATITATAGGKSATCKVVVAKKVIAVESIELNKTTLELVEENSETLVAMVKPDNATDKAVTWTTSNASIATVENGKVTAIKEGEATITAVAGGKSATCKVVVAKKVIEVSSVELNKTTLELIEGDVETLVATVKPDDATDKTVTWSTSDSAVATVENGNVTAVKEGSATIIANAGDCSTKCTVIVIGTEQAKSIQFDDNNLKVALVEKYDLNNDGEMSYYEASKVISLSLGTARGFTSFDEFQYFVNVPLINSYCFYEWSQLLSIVLPKSIVTINSYGFSSCDELNSVVLNDGLVEIGQSAFQYCYKLENISIPNTVTTIGDYAFNNCKSLKEINIPEGITKINYSAFYSCFKLNKVVLPSSLEFIDTYAFGYCPIEAVTIPYKVRVIGEEAFTAAKIVYLEPIQVPKGSRKMFSSKTKIYVPAESLDAYKKAEYWNAYSDQIEAMPNENNN